MLMVYLLSAQWIKQTSIPEYASLRGIFFLDQSHGWCVGWNDSHYSTINGGNTWELMDSLVAEHLDNVHFVDNNKGWVGGADGIWYTNNGGFGTNGNWIQQWDTWGAIYAKPFFIDYLTGWFIETTYSWPSGYTGSSIYRTTDGGSNWIQAYSTEWEIYDITFIDSLKGWAVGAMGSIIVIHTVDGGINWEPLTISNNKLLSSVCFVDSLSGWSTGYNYSDDYSLIFHTLDGGITWQQQGDTLDVWLNDITFVDPLNGWAVGDSGTILHTSNGGMDWEIQESGTLAQLYTISFVDNNLGWICGDSGTILHTNNGGIITAIRKSPSLYYSKKNCNYIKIYPNPVRTNAAIEFFLSETDHIMLSIFDITGKKLQIIYSEKLGKGNHTINWNAEAMKGGIYFIRLETGNKTISRKLLIKN